MTSSPSPKPAAKRVRAPKRTSYKPVDILEVQIWGKRVGAVALDMGTGYFAFQYAPAFLAHGIELAPLQMPLSQGARAVTFPHLSVDTFYRLPALLADALPDRFGNSLINAWMADKGVPATAVTALDRLAYTGSRGMGALTFKPARGPASTKSFAIEMANLVEAARRTAAGQLSTDDAAHKALNELMQLGTSAGGARAKAVIAWNPSTQEVRSGQFDIPAGFEAWLLKFDGVAPTYKDLGPSETYGRIEYAYSLMAHEAGVHMNPCRLLQENGRAHFMTKRFDRDAGGQRHHMQTLGAMAHLDYNLTGVHSYSQLFQTINALGLGRAALIQSLHRMVFNVLACNRDDHPKNFSFLLRQGATQWELAPAYDLTFAFDPANKWTARHLMSVNGKFEHITKDDLRTVAEQFDLLAEFPAVYDRVQRAVDRWESFAESAGVEDDWIKKVRSGYKSARS